MTRDEYADRLAEVAAELVVRVRDEGPADNAAWLSTALPNPADRDNLLYVLAAAVPDDRSWLALTAWTRATGPAPARLQPHGTHAAAQRHRYRGQPLCDECREAERARDRDRKKTAYHRRKAAVVCAGPTHEETQAA